MQTTKSKTQRAQAARDRTAHAGQCATCGRAYRAGEHPAACAAADEWLRELARGGKRTLVSICAARGVDVARAQNAAAHLRAIRVLAPRPYRARAARR